MSTERFTTALRAEIEALVGRYEAMVTLREESVLASMQAHASALGEQLRSVQQQLEQATQREHDAHQQLQAAQSELASSRARCEQLHQALESERTRLAQQSLQAGEELAAVQQRVRQLEAELERVADLARVLDEVFAGEQAFVRASQELGNSPLLAALEQALGAPITPTPDTYGKLKGARLDVVLTRAFKDRAHSLLDSPLTADERRALGPLAAAAGCELIEVPEGQRFGASSMDRIATSPDPAEEGNVLQCLMPGLRLCGSDGALVFPKVRVAVG